MAADIHSVACQSGKALISCGAGDVDSVLPPQRARAPAWAYRSETPADLGADRPGTEPAAQCYERADAPGSIRLRRGRHRFLRDAIPRLKRAARGHRDRKSVV